MSLGDEGRFCRENGCTTWVWGRGKLCEAHRKPGTGGRRATGLAEHRSAATLARRASMLRNAPLDDLLAEIRRRIEGAAVAST